MSQAYASALMFPIFERIQKRKTGITQKDYKQVVDAVVDIVKKIEEKPKFKIGTTIEPVRKVIVRVLKGNSEEKKITVTTGKK
jgi:hypothetical protein